MNATLLVSTGVFYLVIYVRSEVLTTIKISIVVLSMLTPCGLVKMEAVC
jgi:hypothetical protein